MASALKLWNGTFLAILVILVVVSLTEIVRSFTGAPSAVTKSGQATPDASGRGVNAVPGRQNAGMTAQFASLSAVGKRSAEAGQSLGTQQSSRQDTPAVVVSLTTIWRSIPYLGDTLTSLLQQTRPPDKVYIALPIGLPLPPFQDPRIEVLWHDMDIGPMMKYVPVVQHLNAINQSDTLIIVVDDDKIYPPTLVEDLVRAHSKRPGAAFCCRGYVLDGDCRYRDELERSIYGHWLREEVNGVEVDAITGSDAYLIQPSYVNSSLWDWRNATLFIAARMDDLWISGHLAQRGVRKFVAPCRDECVDTDVRGYDSHGRIRTHGTPRATLNSVISQHYCGLWLRSRPPRPSPGRQQHKYMDEATRPRHMLTDMSATASAEA